MINAGSSSIKVTLHKESQVVSEAQINGDAQEGLIEDLGVWIDENVADKELVAVGHRIVHGGGKFSATTLLDEIALEDLRSLVALDSEHLPLALTIIDEVTNRFPGVPQIACFDTGFFQNLPRTAQIIPLPREYESIGLRKYGFHGLAYQSVLHTLSHDYSVDVASSRIICAHLGSGVSLAAIANGEPLDTTMTMTPASGVPMSTRSGSLDPGIVNYLHKTNGMTVEEFDRVISKSSGLLGISETSADMLTLLNQEASDVRSKEAVDVFCYEIKKAIGSLTAVLGGVDVLVFSGGIGEKAPDIRNRICEGLEYVGIELDSQLNQENAGVISAEDVLTSVFAIHADEASVIAGQVQDYVSQRLTRDNV